MPNDSAQETHIASFVLHVLPDRLEDLANLIEQTPMLEEGARSEAGKLVVLAESRDQQALIEAMETLESLPGVLECILVYHEVMSVTEAGQQLITLSHAPTGQQEMTP